jgi:hypothetical protein
LGLTDCELCVGSWLNLRRLMQIQQWKEGRQIKILGSILGLMGINK